MPQPKHPVLRIVLPLVVLIAGIGVAFSVMRNTGSQATPPAPAPGQSGSTAPPAPGPAAPVTPAQPGAATPPAPSPSPPPEVPSLGALRPRVYEGPAGGFSPVGSLSDPDTTALVEFSPFGAGVKSITLSRYFDTIERKPGEQVVLQHEHRGTYTRLRRDAEGRPLVDSQGRPLLETSYDTVATPLAATAVEINGTTVDLSGLGAEAGGDPDSPAHVWRQVAPGSFEAEVLDASGAAVARVTRLYRLKPGLHEIELHQAVHNLTPGPMTVRWWQYGPADLPEDINTYGGDARRVKFGYLAPPAVDPSRQFVLTQGYETLARATVLGTPDAAKYVREGSTVWPNDRSIKNQYDLVWTGLSNRYFGVAVFPLLPAGATDKVLHPAQTVYSVVLDPGGAAPTLALQTRSEVMTAPAGGAADLSVSVYAGPLSKPEIRLDPSMVAVGLPRIVVYNSGGACGWCTFPVLSGALLSVLHVLHDYLVHDWALSILLLVLLVRTCLHPVTKWSQVRMARFGKQMQGMAPKQKKVQEKFKDDPKRQREEMAKLWREEGISPTGALGCLPMFLQTPIWIALYAMLQFAVELRQAPAFFGLFQTVAPGHPRFMGWFLGDLSAPDHFYHFGRVIATVPVFGPIDAINLLPLLLAVVFFIQQKYLTPPQTAPMSPEQEQTQKIMKVMMVILFPLMMYRAPSGLALYFICNSTLGIIESKYIRAHIDKHDLLAPKEKKPGTGWLARLQARAADRQKQLARLRQSGGRKR
ncbi:MAG: membrane protein insertase YidC [Phycisphaerales bacterium]|nr:membrane protein insertase YidC [Phycisphaerales bacterium]